jgi:hypothetical protein
MEHFYQKLEGWFSFPKLYSEIVKTLPNNGIFVEIGVWKGKSLSYFIVETINNNKELDIYAVDTWLGSKEHQEGQGAYDPAVKNNTLYSEFIQNLMPVHDKFKILKMTSEEASKKFKDNTIDALFIDASHEYEDVLIDLNSWYPKLKHGGYFCGHDYVWPGVTRALNEFLSNKSEKLTIQEDCWITKKQ